MEISELADSYLGYSGGVDLSSAGIGAGIVCDIAQNEQYADPLIATFFWQAFLSSRAIHDLLGGLRLTTLAQPGIRNCLMPGVAYVVRHGRLKPRYDLFVFLPELAGCSPIVVDQVDISSQQIVDGWSNFGIRVIGPWAQFLYSRFGQIGPEPHSDVPQAYLTIGGEAALNAYEAQPFGIIFLSPPDMILTSSSSSPSPALNVRLSRGGPAVATVGVLGRNRNGAFVATTASHAIPDHVSHVFVEDLEGKVEQRNAITDSCFIAIPEIKAFSGRELKGPLCGKTPGNFQNAFFEGVASGRTTTTITGWSYHIPHKMPYMMSTVISTADSAPGDSGSALVDPEENVVGFAYARSAYDAPVQLSLWIWAESVFDAYNTYALGSEL